MDKNRLIAEFAQVVRRNRDSFDAFMEHMLETEKTKMFATGITDNEAREAIYLRYCALQEVQQSIINMDTNP